MRPEVVVDPEQVDRTGDGLEVPRLDHVELGPERGVVVDEIRRIGAPEERVEEPAVQVPVGEGGGPDVLLAIGPGIDRVEVEGDPDLAATARRPERLDGPGVPEQHVVCGADRTREVIDPRRMSAVEVADERRHPWLVQRDPAIDPVAQHVEQRRRVVGELAGGVAGDPAAPRSWSAWGRSQW